jgi:hypothetical protein
MHRKIPVKNGTFTFDAAWKLADDHSRNSVATSISFSPNPLVCPKCNSITFIQIARVTIGGKDWIWDGDDAERNDVKTKADPKNKIEGNFFVDHFPKNKLFGRCSPYVMDQWLPGLAVIGSNAGKTSIALSKDTPGHQPVPNVKFEFETCAVCADHEPMDYRKAQVLGCIRWGFSFDRTGMPIFADPIGTDSPSPTFVRALEQFHDHYRFTGLPWYLIR